MRFVFILVLMSNMLVGCVIGDLTGENDYGFKTDRYGRRISWKGRVPVLLYFDSSVPPQFYRAIENAANTWSNAVGYPLFTFGGVLPNSTPGYDGKNVIYWMTTFPGPSVFSAETAHRWEGPQILEADILFNAQNVTFSVTPDQNQVDVESIALHELGHVLGRIHEENQLSVMNPVLINGMLRRDLYQVDIDDIRAEYWPRNF